MWMLKIFIKPSIAEKTSYQKNAQIKKEFNVARIQYFEREKKKLIHCLTKTARVVPVCLLNTGYS
jgi:hypothetical protein